MEIAVPLIALGGLYVASNQDNLDNKNKNNKEAYENMGKSTNYLPNNNTPPKNYPTNKPVKKNNTKKYNNPNTVTDRYFNQETYEEYKNGPDQFGTISNSNEMMSLTGSEINKSDFKHNNMVPFFGARIKGSTVDANMNETVLDNMNGSGSQQIRKQEQAPLFAPQKNMRYANGAPNQSDFLQSRVNPSSKMSNVKLWEEQRVAPGLDLGYTTEGQLGFNAGIDARDKWVDKNVDQLRVDTNPKLTYSLENHQGPATYYNNAPATKETQGAVEKHLPDTYFINTPDRWLTTTGLEKGQTSRAIEVNKDVNRTTTSMEYFGADSNPDGTKMYTTGENEAPKRPELEATPIANPSQRGGGRAREGDYGVQGYKALPNNRSISKGPELGTIHGAVRAVVAPLLDVLRPSRKENVIGNYRPNGNAGTTVSAPTVFNPADRTPTTIRETTEGKLDNTHLNVEGQTNGGYLVNKQTPIENQRDTTNTSYTGNSGGMGAQTGNAVYNAAYNQRNNVNKTYVNRPNQGGMGLLNSNENMKIDKRDNDRDNNRMWAPQNHVAGGSVPSMETHGKMNMPQYYDNCQSCERIQPDILTAFKENPYTQSLNSFY
jgi:hypothetical protein